MLTDQPTGRGRPLPRQGGDPDYIRLEVRDHHDGLDIALGGGLEPDEDDDDEDDEDEDDEDEDFWADDLLGEIG